MVIPSSQSGAFDVVLRTIKLGIAYFREGPLLLRRRQHVVVAALFQAPAPVLRVRFKFVETQTKEFGHANAAVPLDPRPRPVGFQLPCSLLSRHLSNVGEGRPSGLLRLVDREDLSANPRLGGGAHLEEGLDGPASHGVSGERGAFRGDHDSFDEPRFVQERPQRVDVRRDVNYAVFSDDDPSNVVASEKSPNQLVDCRLAASFDVVVLDFKVLTDLARLTVHVVAGVQ